MKLTKQSPSDKSIFFHSIIIMASFILLIAEPEAGSFMDRYVVFILTKLASVSLIMVGLYKLGAFNEHF